MTSSPPDAIKAEVPHELALAARLSEHGPQFRKRMAEVISRGVTPDYFTDRLAGSMFAALRDLYQSGQQPDLRRIAERIPPDTTTFPIDTVTETISKFRHADLSKSLNRLINLKALRDIGGIGTWIAEQATDPSSKTSPLDLLSGIRDRIDLVDVHGKTKYISAATAADELYRQFVDAISGKTFALKLPPGFEMLDRATCGLYPGLTVYAARPKIGKSSSAMEMIRRWAKAGIPCAVIPTEMSELQIVDRWVARECERSTFDFKMGRASKEEMDRETKNAFEQIREYPVTFHSGPATVNDIEYWIQSEQDRTGVKVAVVDTIGKIKPPGRGFNVFETATHNIGRLAEIGDKKLRIPIIGIHHINRVADQFKRPAMENLRDSGSAEQDAQAIIVQYEVQDPKTVDPKAPDRSALGNDSESVKFVITDVIGSRNGGMNVGVLYRADLEISRWDEIVKTATPIPSGGAQ